MFTRRHPAKRDLEFVDWNLELSYWAAALALFAAVRRAFVLAFIFVTLRWCFFLATLVFLFICSPCFSFCYYLPAAYGSLHE
jgi:hypothetical protein